MRTGSINRREQNYTIRIPVLCEFSPTCVFVWGFVLLRRRKEIQYSWHRITLLVYLTGLIDIIGGDSYTILKTC